MVIIQTNILIFNHYILVGIFSDDPQVHAGFGNLWTAFFYFMFFGGLFSPIIKLKYLLEDGLKTPLETM